MGFGALTDEMKTFLEAIVVARQNIVVSGGTGSGKTTLINCLSGYIPDGERVVTIEDAAELQLKQRNVVRLETKKPSPSSPTTVTVRDCVVNALRMRPERIVVGECRAGEALDMLQAMNTGHDGSLTTVHSNSPRDAMSRVETMVAMTGLDLPQRAVRQQLASALDVIIQLSRLSDGTRKLVSLQEVTGMEGEIVVMQEIFRFDRQGLGEEGRVIGKLGATGIRPNFAERLRLSGADLPAEIFARGGL